MPKYKVKKDMLKILVPTEFKVDSVIDLDEETAAPFVADGGLEEAPE